MLRDPKLSRCATLVECVCVNVFREFEFFFLTPLRLRRKVFLFSNQTPSSDIQRSTTRFFPVPVVDDRLLFSRFLTHFSILFLSRFPSFHRVSVATIFASANRLSQKRTGGSDVLPGAK